MLAKLYKLEKATTSEQRDRVLARIFQFVRGETSQEAEDVRKRMQEEVDYLNEENANLIIELNESKRRIQNMIEKT